MSIERKFEPIELSPLSLASRLSPREKSRLISLAGSYWEVCDKDAYYSAMRSASEEGGGPVPDEATYEHLLESRRQELRQFIAEKLGILGMDEDGLLKATKDFMNHLNP